MIPRFVRDRIDDFAANLIFPRNLVANLLQGSWRSAGTETARFAVNTTVGLAGFWDPATRWLDIEAAPEDFGQVFARLGLASLDVRRAADRGTELDPRRCRPDPGLVLDPAFYFFPAGPVLTFNEQVDSIDRLSPRLANSSFDLYDDAQLLWSVTRDEEIEGAPIERKGDDTGAVQTLQAAFLGPRDPGFASRSRHARGADAALRARAALLGAHAARSRADRRSSCPVSARIGSAPRASRSPRWPGTAASRSRS